jgi:hypothetical protein
LLREAYLGKKQIIYDKNTLKRVLGITPKVDPVKFRSKRREIRSHDFPASITYRYSGGEDLYKFTFRGGKQLIKDHMIPHPTS